MRRCRLPCPGSVRLSFHLYFRPGCRNQPDYVLNPDLNPARDHNPDPDRNRGQNGNSGFHPDNHHPGHHTDNNPDHCPDRRSGNRICLRNLFCSHPDFRPPAGFSFRCCRHTGLPERFHLYNRHRSQSPPGYTRCLIRLWSPAGRRCNLLPRCYNGDCCFLNLSFLNPAEAKSANAVLPYAAAGAWAMLTHRCCGLKVLHQQDFQTSYSAAF